MGTTLQPCKKLSPCRMDSVVRDPTERAMGDQPWCAAPGSPGELMVRVHNGSKPAAWGSVHSLCLLAPEGCETKLAMQ